MGKEETNGPKGRPMRDWAGMVLGNLTVVRLAYVHRPSMDWVWECLCRCGKTCYKSSHAIRRRFKKGHERVSGHDCSLSKGNQKKFRAGAA